MTCFGRVRSQARTALWTAASLTLALALLPLASAAAAAPQRASHPPDATTGKKLLHASFGFTRAFYADYNRWFIEKWRRQTGETVTIEQSHGPSGTQTEAIVAGKLQPDVITLASPSDIDHIARETKLLPAGWRKAFPDASSPSSSAVVFLVRAGNPKQIKDWSDLALPDRTLVTSNPKACGGGRWNYTGAVGLGTDPDDSDAQRREYLSGFVKNIPVVYANQGEAGEAFLKDGKGDVLLTYESFALSLTAKPGAQVELVVPSRTVEIELPIAVAETIAARNGTTKLARAYLRGLYEPEAQALLAKHFFRPRSKVVAAQTAASFPKVTLVKGETIFGSWQRAEREHFAEGALFDVLYAQRTSGR